MHIDATHIFDGLDDFATHIAHMRLGTFVTQPVAWPATGEQAAALPGTSLYRVALQWLTDDRDYRRTLEKDGRKQRGARKTDVGRPGALLHEHKLTLPLGSL